MIIVAQHLEQRLDRLWLRLQRFEHRGPMGQVHLDEACVNTLESFVTGLEDGARAMGTYNPETGEWRTQGPWNRED